jgi:hypothetical protein
MQRGYPVYCAKVDSEGFAVLSGGWAQPRLRGFSSRWLGTRSRRERKAYHQLPNAHISYQRIEAQPLTKRCETIRIKFRIDPPTSAGKTTYKTNQFTPNLIT